MAEFRFLLEEVFDFEGRVGALPGLGDASMDLVRAVLDNAGRLASEVLLPINLRGDAQGCSWSPGGVRTPHGYAQAYATYRAGGWPSLAADPAWGGQGLPQSLALFVRELFAAGSMAFGMYGGLSQGAYRAIAAHGSEALKNTYLPPLVDGRWTGTMCLTEADSGSDLSRLRTRAVPAGDGSHRITGSKIFISGGDHDLAENIVHLVLARLPDAPAGTRGISLFVVPKLLPDTDGSAASRQSNGVVCTAIEHKMGIAGSATAALSFENSVGWMIGEPHGGLRAMFTMMNASRLGVAVQSVGVAELSLQNARRYAAERRQGRAPNPAGTPARPNADLIVEHPDVKRTLLVMKALVEGVRAMYVEAAFDLDVRARHRDEVQRQAAEERLALMTPVLKSFVSDSAVEVARLGMTVFGGHGYIRETGMEQLLRDAHIVPLYEGTNAIQALDLVHRKLAGRDGGALKGFVDGVAASIDAAFATPGMAELARPLHAALDHLQEATDMMRSRAAADPVAAAAGASDYLRLFGLVACGQAWLRMALRAVAGGGQSSRFYAGKLKTARFYMSHLLSQTAPLLANVLAPADIVAGVHAEEL